MLTFLPAWTFDFWQAWLFWAVFTAAQLTITLYFLRTDPHLIEDRSKAGPRVESRPAQKLILLVPFLFAVLAARLIDEERFLLANLRGYSDYRLKVRHHIVPYVLVNSFFPSVRFKVAGVPAVDGWTLILRAHTFVVRL